MFLLKGSYRVCLLRNVLSRSKPPCHPTPGTQGLWSYWTEAPERVRIGRRPKQNAAPKVAKMSLDLKAHLLHLETHEISPPPALNMNHNLSDYATHAVR